MPASPEHLTLQRVMAVLTPLLPRPAPATLPSAAPLCTWCHGPTVWTTGNKTRCTRCGYVPS